MNELTPNNLDSKATRFLLDTCPSSDCTVKVLAVLVSELGAFLLLKWRPQPRPVTGCSMCGVLDASCCFASSPAWHILAVLPNVSATHRNSFCFILVGSKNNLLTNHWIIFILFTHTAYTKHPPPNPPPWAPQWRDQCLPTPTSTRNTATTTTVATILYSTYYIHTTKSCSTIF